MKELLSNKDVALVSSSSRYPAEAPFNPPEIYPEYPHGEAQADLTNKAYAMVRESFRLLGLDEANFERSEWNPLGALISPGDRVLIKPNFVLHLNAGGGPLEAVVTHPSVLRAIADYVIIALGSRGELIIGDSPQMNCDLAKLYRATGMDRLVEFLQAFCAGRGIRFQAVDFRREQAVYKHGIVWSRKPLNENREKPITVSLGQESFMEEIDNTRLYGADYCRRVTVEAHSGSRHEYVIAPEVLSSDVVISVPKLKVHRKVGATLNLKNMVGINSDKNHLAHYRVGSPVNGGDEFRSPKWDDRLERRLSDALLGTDWRIGKYPFLAWRAFRKILRHLRSGSGNATFAYGNWHGNDTAWRMVLDLNRVLLFADSEGRLHTEPVRRYFSVVDGIVGGEGEGPLHPDAYPSGVLLAGFNPLAVDWVATRLMGFSPRLIPLYMNALKQMREWMPDFAIEDCRVRSNIVGWENILRSEEPIFKFSAPAGWRGKIECYNPSQEASSSQGAPVMDTLSQ